MARAKKAKAKGELVVAAQPAVNKYKPKLSILPAHERAAILDQVLDRYMNGEQVRDFAADYNCTKPPIYHALLSEREDEWRQAQTARALSRLEDATADMEKAQDGLSLARAEKVVRSAQWELERLLKRLYGVDNPQAIANVAIQINIGRKPVADKPE